MSAEEVRSFILTKLEPRLLECGIDPQNVPDDLDLYAEEIVDSMGLLEIVCLVEDHLGIELDFEDLSPEELTVIGRFTHYIEQKHLAADEPLA